MLQSASAAEEDWTFLDSSWSPEQFSKVSQNMHVASADAKFANVRLIDIITGNSRHSIDWTKVCEGTKHTADETKIKITSMWKEKRIKQLIKTKEIIESK